MADLPHVILIDGLAGTGKTTLARRLSASHGYSYLDSGMLYRAAAWQHLRDPLTKPMALLTDITVRPGQEPDQPQGVLIGQVWLRTELWTEAVSDCVAEVASWPDVRRSVSTVCEDLVAGNRIAITGRDMGRLDAHGAGRIELSCDDEPRLARLAGRGETSAKRDDLESKLLRHYLRSDERAISIDTSTLSLDEVYAVAVRALAARPCP